MKNIAALVSGGKDSIYSIMKLIRLGYSISSLVCLVPKNKESYMFHSINTNIVKYISYSTGIQLYYQETSGIKEDELEDLKIILNRLKIENNISGVCSGAIQSVYQKSRIDNICESLNLESITPLWNYDLEVLLKEMVQYLDIRIVSVNADGFDKSWLGKKLTFNTINELKILNKKYKINIAGEGGEFETIVLDAPFYKYKLSIEKSYIDWFTNYGNYTISKIRLLKKK